MKVFNTTLLALLGLLGSTQADYWTNYVSDGWSPEECRESDALVTGFKCRGSFCDDVRLRCKNPSTSKEHTYSYWTNKFSEESGDVKCAKNHFVTGVACAGHFCDNLSMRCTYKPGRGSSTDCDWTSLLSEEAGGTDYFRNGYYLRGMRCHGSYCDNKKFFICKTT